MIVSAISALTKPVFEGPIGRFFLKRRPYLQAFLAVWGRLYIPAIVSIIATIVFWRLPQFSEIYVELALDAIEDSGPGSHPTRSLVRAVLSGTFLWLSGLALWYFSRLSLLDGETPMASASTDTPPPNPPETKFWRAIKGVFRITGLRGFFDLARAFFSDPDAFRKGLGVWMPRLIGLIPALGVFGGAIRAISSRTSQAISDTDADQILLEVEALVVMGVVASGIAFSILMIQFARHSSRSFLNVWMRSLPSVLLSLVAMILLFNEIDQHAEKLIADQFGAAKLLILAYGAVALAVAVQLIAFSIGFCVMVSGEVPLIQTLPRAGEWLITGLLAVVGLILVTATSLVSTAVAFVGNVFEDSWLQTLTGLPSFPGNTLASIAMFAVLILGISLAMKHRAALPDNDRIEAKVMWRGEDGKDLRSLGTLTAFVFCVIAIILPFDSISVTVTQWLGPISIVGLYTIAAAGIGALLMSWSRRHSLPIAGVVLILPFFLSFEHHFIRTQKAIAPGNYTAYYSVNAGFVEWKAARDGRCETPIIVAAQGGGHFAAHHLAFFLAKTHDEAKRLGFDFAECIFAISGISGGSVGAGPFAAALDLTRHNDLDEIDDPTLVAEVCRVDKDAEDDDASSKDSAKNDPRDRPDCHLGPVTRLVHAALRQDLLSPLGARMLFSDVLGNYIPTSYFDRARALDGVVRVRLKGGFRDEMRLRGRAEEVPANHTTLLSRQIFEAWSPEKGYGPALFLNTVDVSSGQRFVMSPFRAIRDGRHPMTYSHFVQDCREDWEGLLSGEVAAPNVGTAMFMSARFPFFTPPAAINVGGGCMKPQVIDGGAFDNSGVETARDIINAIQATPGLGGQDFALLVVGFESAPEPADLASGRLPMDEVLAPASAFFKSWRVRTKRSKELVDAYFMANQRLCGPADAQVPCGQVDVYKNRLPDEPGREFTLSWLLSRRTFDRIAKSTGVWDAFRQGALSPPLRLIGETIPAFETRKTTFANTCDLRRLFLQIMPGNYSGNIVDTSACRNADDDG
ncbi:MAG: hypothetical protein AAF557_04390 [Pseudomonadota bacterium]